MATPQQQQTLKEPAIAPPEGAEVQKSHAAPKLHTKDLDFFYGNFQALYDISISIAENKITAFIGPALGVNNGHSIPVHPIIRMDRVIAPQVSR